MVYPFGNLPENFSRYDDADIVIVPVPYDGTSTWLKGADRGPAAIIEASGHMELYDIDTDSEVYRRGIATDNALDVTGSPEEMALNVTNRVREHLKADKYPVLLGGEHSITIGSVGAMRDAYPDLTVLQLDAHADLRDEYEGSRFNHACVMARVKELCPAVQAGIRSMDISESRVADRSGMILASEIMMDPCWKNRILDALGEKVYVTIDLDVFDPSVLPATGTPEPGGLTWYQVTDLLREVAARKKVVGFDIVELCPNRFSMASDFLAAKLTYTFLSHIFKEANNE